DADAAIDLLDHEPLPRVRPDQPCRSGEHYEFTAGHHGTGLGWNTEDRRNHEKHEGHEKRQGVAEAEPCPRGYIARRTVVRRGQETRAVFCSCPSCFSWFLLLFHRSSPLPDRRDSGFAVSTNSEEFLDRFDAVVDESEGPALGPGQLSGGVDAEGVVRGRGDLGGGDGPVLWGVADLVGGADDATALDRAAGEQHGPAGRMVVAPAGRVDLRRPA